MISNANYLNTSALANPPHDAAAVAQALRAVDFGDVEILRDATAEVLRKRLRDFALKSRLADVSVIYYAGHGIEAEGQNYLLPVDARLETDLDINYETVSIDLAVRAVNGAKKLKLLILDACRINPLAGGIQPDGKSRTFGVGLAPIETAGDVLISYAAAAGQFAEDGREGDNSPFAKALVQNIGAAGVDVRQVLGKVRDAVLAATSHRQRPFIYASLGGDPIYLVPPPDAPPPAPSPVVVDFTIADPADEVVSQILGVDKEQFGFGYELKISTKPTRSVALIPKLDYFTSAAERGRPLIRSLVRGYFAPEEGAPWALSFPLLDIIARRDLPRVITLSEVVVEVEASATDPAPYVGVMSPANQFARLVLFNEGWSDVKRAKIEYDVLGFKEPDRRKLDELLKAKRDGGYTHSAATGPFEDFATISLAGGLSKSMPDFRMYEYAFKASPWELGPNGKPRRPSGMPPGYNAWIKANAHVHSADRTPGDGVWIAGRLVVEAAAPGVATIFADFVAPVAVYAPSELGGGAIEYNLKSSIALKVDGRSYTVRRNVGYLLDQDAKTFRGLFPLTAERTSRHRLRVVVVGDGGRQLYASEWIDAHIVVPRLSKKATDWATKPNPTGRPPFRGIR